ncbi:hypothetical protein [Streptacidiphilus jeojiense]|uniref:hypothetical protein n=1 Tax=Streptacidiphilus jeojiense TaxID=436229 RepID=UPI0004C2896F|nr:hypothetical protein [Streptacidiphilus jeojiense]
MPTLYEISDGDTGQLRAVTRTGVPEALDAACLQLSAELEAGGEGSSMIRYRLAVHQVTPDGTRTWRGQRLYYPGGPRPPQQQET